MGLQYNSRSGDLFLVSNETDLPEKVGLTLSNSVRGPNGENIWFSTDSKGDPEFNPFAMLPFYQAASDEAKEVLQPYWDQYLGSRAVDADIDIPAPLGLSYLPYQKAGIKYAGEHGNCIIGDEPGLGKAQPMSAKVRVPGGWRLMGDIKVGDGVCGYDGTGGRVVGVYDRGTMDVYRVTFSDGSCTEVSEDHLWRVQYGSATRLSEPTVVPTWQVLEKLKKGNKIRIPMAAPLENFQDRTQPVDPYLVGLLLGDGGLTQRIPKISTADEEIREFCAGQALSFGLTLKHSDAYDYNFTAETSSTSPNPLKQALEGIGIMGHGAYTKFVPDEYLNGSINTRLRTLQGLMDSDGWIYEGVTGFGSVSEQLCDDVKELVQSLGGVARKSKKKKRNPVTKEVTGDFHTLTINIPVCPFRLGRKVRVWAPNKKYPPARLFKSIEKVGREPVRCIEVTCKDHLYVTDDYIVTHNTIQAIGIANLFASNKVLVVCPASIRLNWQREIRKWSVLPQVKTYPVLKSTDGVNPYANYVIISYELLRNEGIHNAICAGKWDLLVLDEAHYLKNHMAKRTQAVFGGGRGLFGKQNVADRCSRIVGLTGTPLPNRPRECYTLARGMCWEAVDWATYDDFTYRYNPAAKMDKRRADGSTTVYKKEERGRLPELRNRLRCNFMVRRLKKEVLKDLPDKRYEFTYMHENGKVKDILKREKLIDFNLEDLINPFTDITEAIATMRREMGEAMVPQFVEHIRYLLDIVGLEKVVVFCYHKEVMRQMNEALANYGVATIKGGMSPQAKDDAVQSFIHGKNRIFNGQITAAGTGIDGLQGVCSHVVVCEADWSPGVNEQAVDRCHRIGQHDNVTAQFLVAEGSLGERIIKGLLEKSKNSHEALDAEQ